MSDSVSAAPAAASRSRPAAAPKAARRNNTEGEIRLLHGGVSIADVAAREGEERMRARLQESFARRLPERPAEVLALLACDGAVAKANLEAIDRVAELARQFDPTHGFAAAGCSHEAETLSLAAPAQNPLALPAPPFGRPEMPPQALEKPRFAPGNGALSRRSRETTLPRAGRSRSPLTGRLEMLPQALEKPQFAPGNGAPFLAPAETSLLQAGRSRSPLTRRPEMLSQAIENAQNAPGNGMALQVWTPQYLVRGLADEVPSPLVGSRGEASASQPDSARFASSTQ